MQRSTSRQSLQWPTEQATSAPTSSVLGHCVTNPHRSQETPEERLQYPDEVGRDPSEEYDQQDTVSATTAHNAAEYGPVPDDENSSNNVVFQKTSLTATTILTDCLVCALPLAVLVSVVAVWRLDGSRTSDGSLEAWQNALAILATLFPILFASVIGRLMSATAKWKLENGSSIGTLEQLMGSRTVGSTIQAFYQYRAVNFLGATLLVIWMFSPLGAQAFLRILKPTSSPVFEATQITYFDSMSASRLATLQITDYSPDHVKSAFLTYVNSLYTAIISTPESVKLDTMDLWGNVKIPLLHPNATNAEWMDTSGNASDVQYSSLAGIPLSYTQTGNTTLLLESSHLYLDCSNVTKITGETTTMSSDLLTATDLKDPGELQYLNGTWYGNPSYNRSDSENGVSTTWGIALDRFIDSYWQNKSSLRRTTVWQNIKLNESKAFDSPALFEKEEGIAVGPTNVLLQIEFPPGVRAPSKFVEATCGVHQQYVESRVSCMRSSLNQQNCTVTAIRPSQKQRPSEHISYLSFPRLFNHVARQLPIATGQTMNQYADLSINYLKDPMFKTIASDPAVTVDQIMSLDPRTIGIRFSQLLNTYLTLSQLSFEITSGSTGTNANFQAQAETGGGTSRLVEYFRISKLWAALCVISCIIVLLGGILSVVFTHLTNGPEILGYVSTIVRDSRLIKLASDARWLDGPELTLRIRKRRVLFGLLGQEQGPKNGFGEPGIGYQEDMKKFTAAGARH